jgi:hypothetical protein
MVCVGGNLQDTCSAGSPTGADAACDGLDQNCNGVADDAYVPTATSCGVGECAATGQMVCVAGALQDTCVAGSPTGADADCDGLDQNCNGAADDAYIPTATSCGVGECASTGQMVCVGGALQDTCAAGLPTGADADCDGLDQNCNGIADDTYVPTATSCGVGECSSTGQMICVGGALQDTCAAGSPTGADADCDGLDQNCNGIADDTYVPTATSCGVGECASTGEMICVGGALQDTCSAGSPTGADAECDGLDQNCNGVADDAYVPTATSCGVGECAAAGQMICVGGALQDTCSAGSPTGADNECDGIDQNCNGIADDAYMPTATSCGVGECASTGQIICVGGALQDTCSVGSPTGADADCDGLDQNCNGVADDAYAPTATSCGVGECTATGQMICVDGTLQDTCTPGTPSAEICDGLDNNCDGQVDEGVELTFYQDADGDTYGNVAVTIEACSAPTGYVANSTDCDDTKANVHPGATEVCGNGIDEDCNGSDLACSDIIPPAVNCPADIQVLLLCGGAPAGTPAIQTFLNAATATDNIDGTVPVTNNAPGIFGVGLTVVTFTATDSSGNASSCQASVHVKYGYSGILQPINADGSSVFKIGRAVPVKFKLYCSGATPVGAAPATLSVFKVTNVVTGTVTEVETVPIGEANTGNLFRYDPVEQQYIYNWSTKGLTAGTYQLRISLDDATTYNANLSLKAK